jgi:hypothetical protein
MTFLLIKLIFYVILMKEKMEEEKEKKITLHNIFLQSVEKT